MPQAIVDPDEIRRFVAMLQESLKQRSGKAAAGPKPKAKKRA